MEIGKVPQNSGQIVGNAESGNVQEVSGNSGVDSKNQVEQKDFQVNVDDTLKAKLADLVKSLQNRSQLIQLLPENIKEVVQQFLQEMSSKTDLSQGMESILKSQKNIVDQLNNFGNLLELSANLQADDHIDIQVLIKDMAEIVKGQPDILPEQSANELLQLAKQFTALPQGEVKQAIDQFLQQLLPENMENLSGTEKNIVLQLEVPLQSNSIVTPEDLKQVAKQLLQQIIPENMQPINENGKNVLGQVVKLLGRNMPPQLEQLAEQTNLPELPQLWAALKIVDAQSFKGVSPKILEQAANVLQQIYREIKSSPDKAGIIIKLDQLEQNLHSKIALQGTEILEQHDQGIITSPEREEMIAKFDQLVKNVSPEIGKALEQALKQAIKQGTPDALLTLAETFDNAAALNGKMSNDVQTLVNNLADNFTVKVPSVPADTTNLLSLLAKKVNENISAAEQLKTLAKLIENQLSNGNPNRLQKEQPVLKQLTALLEKNMPQALQDAAIKNKLPELPKMWALLKAVGTDQWNNTEYQNLQKSAGIVKELVQSMYKSTASETAKQVDHSVLSFSVPLYFADGTNYPAHIHIYHQEKNSDNIVVKRNFETWMRVSMDTQNIGVVDSVFRLYDDDKLDVRVIFPDSPAVSEFTQSIPDIRKSIDDTKLKLTNIMINRA